ncbi:MAG: IS4 family transposase, partial [Tepidisphaeraceae bacterium]
MARDNIRNVKVVLNTEGIAAKSVDMFTKELLMSIVAYNLVTQFRRQAAKMADVQPRRLSFKRTWTTFKTFLWSHIYSDAVDCRTQYHKALKCAMKDKLPNRPGRSFEREAYHKRHKS